MQKWSKGKMKEKVNNQVLFDKVSDWTVVWALAAATQVCDQGSELALLLQSTYEKLQAEVPKYKMITASVLSDRLRVRLLRHISSTQLLCRVVQTAIIEPDTLPSDREQGLFIAWAFKA